MTQLKDLSSSHTSENERPAEQLQQVELNHRKFPVRPVCPVLNYWIVIKEGQGVEKLRSECWSKYSDPLLFNTTSASKSPAARMALKFRLRKMYSLKKSLKHI